MAYRVAVIGATGNVGREVLNILAERDFPIKTIDAFASKRSYGKQVSYGDDKVLDIQILDNIDFKAYDIVFMAAGSDVSKNYAGRFAAHGAVVIDKSSHFRMDPDVPLIVPEVNGALLEEPLEVGIVANPNCVAIPLALALAPLHKAVGIKRVVVSTYQSTSGAGRAPMDELFQQSRGIFVNKSVPHHYFTKQIAFNVIPHIGEFTQDGSTLEEEKVAEEVLKILDATFGVAVTCVRVPVFIGHSMTVAVELNGPLDFEEARRLCNEQDGLVIVDHRQDEGYVTPVECAGEDGVYISRMRDDPSVPHGLLFWVTTDNLRKGAALNAVQMAEALFSI